LGIALLTYSCIYGLYYLRTTYTELYHEIKVLQLALNESFYASAQEIETLTMKLDDAKAKLSFRRHYERELLEEVLPWERCMRFEMRTDCLPGRILSDGEPPCILDVLEEMMFDVVDSLGKSNLTYWISYGTLLGAVRDQKIIPWTTDIDIVVETNIWKRIAKRLYDNSNLDEKGYRFFYDKKYTDMARLCIGDDHPKYKQWEKTVIEEEGYWNSGYPYVDFYQGVPLKGWNYTILAGPPCTFAHSQIFPLVKIPLLGRLVSAPRNYTSYLEQVYGPGWRSPPSREQRDAHGDYYTACGKG